VDDDHRAVVRRLAATNDVAFAEYLSDLYIRPT